MDIHRLTGENVTVAVLDTGLYPHIDYRDRIVIFADFVNYKNYPYDPNGHGTHVCGILAGSGKGCNGRVMGTAPKCNIVGIKVLDQFGNGKKEVILQAFKWLLKNRQRYQIKIVNISVGTTCNAGHEHRELTLGVEELWDAGLIVVAAAGNMGPAPGTVTAPGSSRKIITVGSSDMIENTKDASGRGPTKDCVCKPDIVAPGYEILSCLPYQGEKPAYGRKSGTSMSTPYVSGSIAQMLEKDSHLTNVEIKMLIKESAIDLGFGRNVQGWGLFDRKKFLTL